MFKKYLKKFQNTLLFLMSLITYFLLFASFIWIFSFAYPELLQTTREAAVVSITFVLTFGLMLNAYGGFDVGEKQTRQIVYSLIIVTFIADIFSYVVIQITNPSIWNIWQFGFYSIRRLGFAYVIQVFEIVLMAYLGNKLYFILNKPKKTLILYAKDTKPNKIVSKIKKNGAKFNIAQVMDDSDVDGCHAAIDLVDVVILYNIPKDERVVFSEYCYKQKKAIYFNAEIMDVVEFRSKHLMVDDLSLFTTNISEFSMEDRILKRTLDLTVAIIGFVFTSPLWLIFALAIKAEDGGPVFFKQERATKNGKVFNVMKFRSMKVEAEANKSATKDDDRITKVGKILRKIRLDELPQILNILNGDMSVVGPRPEMLANVKKYTEDMPEFELRLRAKAGLTGYAQIHGKYNTSPKDKLILDLMYIENYSIWLDIKLILQTVMVFLKIDDSTEGFDEWV